MHELRSRRVPTAQGGNRLSETSNSTDGVSYRKEAQLERAFIKERRPTHSLLLKLPTDLHENLRKIAFETKTSSTAIIVKAIRKYLNCE